MYIHIQICVYTCVYICVYGCKYIHNYTHSYTHVYTCISVYVCVYMYIHVCTCIYVYIHVYIHIHTYTSTYVYMYMYVYLSAYVYIYKCAKNPRLRPSGTAAPPPRRRRSSLLPRPSVAAPSGALSVPAPPGGLLPARSPSFLFVFPLFQNEPGKSMISVFIVFVFSNHSRTPAEVAAAVVAAATPRTTMRSPEGPPAMLHASPPTMPGVFRLWLLSVFPLPFQVLFSTSFGDSTLRAFNFLRRWRFGTQSGFKHIPLPR